MIINPHKYPFIVFEGMDGCGKDAQIKMLKKYLLDNGIIAAHFTKEPVEGPGKIGTIIRRILDNGGVVPDVPALIDDPFKKIQWIIELIESKRGQKLTSEELQSLYIADRILHRNGESIFLKQRLVVSDRDWESTLAYHIAFGGSPRWVFDQHEKLFKKAGMEFFIADLTLIIDISANEAINRQQSMGKKFDYFEDAVDKREKIRQAYLKLPEGLKLLSGFPLNIQIVDGMRPKEEVFRDALKHILNAIQRKKEMIK